MYEEHLSLIQGCGHKSCSERKATRRTDTFKKAASANARHAADAVEEAPERVSEFANDVTRKAEKQFSRAANMATDAYEEAHEASKEYPHVTLALAAGFGFLLGVIATRR